MDDLIPYGIVFPTPRKSCLAWVPVVQLPLLFGLQVVLIIALVAAGSGPTDAVTTSATLLAADLAILSRNTTRRRNNPRRYVSRLGWPETNTRSCT